MFHHMHWSCLLKSFAEQKQFSWKEQWEAECQWNTGVAAPGIPVTLGWGLHLYWERDKTHFPSTLSVTITLLLPLPELLSLPTWIGWTLELGPLLERSNQELSKQRLAGDHTYYLFTDFWVWGKKRIFKWCAPFLPYCIFILFVH